MRLELFADLVIEAVEEHDSGLLLAERIREIVAEHLDDLSEMEDLEFDDCAGGACKL